MYKNDLKKKISSLEEEINQLEAEVKILLYRRVNKKKELEKLLAQFKKRQYFAEDRGHFNTLI